ncbi:TPA: hypothetical protein DIU27_02510 [Candidatus Collierbacteria bacterium]|uniref:Uncharacterized protein n=1 Tax=Candidatus Collierbacteria bacterium GW2011_GWB2_44_22 TaxID=1618387 RepID=A0A0G1HWL7_9BACT|nr:MAG: hypothetical protein UW31_C0008G0017 [Candidatus Collierbacteria bacterium GW2011_GWA2_44_13]KKT51506.1 MAG: hypothetical protein UW44_C0011G0017 [Candidatus Collierbacteria bacterium GW2011_GWB2_44_22]KKT62243.1 MAG: hypothetical protein UW56_C0009G0017 [Candidatus Collierbacteria bacterium GW2011_GWD1_44_27]KKT66784.1 MAG: hypothetical protein UW58_C0003G0017 [Candidatus Collierbacteria bacterium GW2011_GWC2_44_30]KKT69052.1 MAG: hypothetical protein UW64_C0005G0013 [Microgenomates gr
MKRTSRQIYHFDPRTYSYAKREVSKRNSEFDTIESTVSHMIPELQKAMGDIDIYIGDPVSLHFLGNWSDVDISVKFSMATVGKKPKEIFLDITHATQPNIAEEYCPTITLKFGLPDVKGKIRMSLYSASGTVQEICYLSDIIVKKWPLLQKE